MKTYIPSPTALRSFFIEHGQKMHYSKRQTFVRADDPQPWVYFLEEGAVEASYVFDYNESKILGYFPPNAVFSQNKLFYESDGDLTYTTIEPTIIYRLHRDEFLRQIETNMDFVKDYLRNTLIIRIFTTDMVIYQGEQTATNRALRWLLVMAKYYGEETSEGVQIQIPLTQDVIANFLHISRESVSKRLREFVRAGYMSVDKKLITVHSVETLKKVLAQ